VWLVDLRRGLIDTYGSDGLRQTVADGDHATLSPWRVGDGDLAIDVDAIFEASRRP
jgi:hypothetical protein